MNDMLDSVGSPSLIPQMVTQGLWSLTLPSAWAAQALHPPSLHASCPGKGGMTSLRLSSSSPRFCKASALHSQPLSPAGAGAR